MKVIGYVRVSTEGQAVDGVSLAAQRARVRAWAEAKGLPLGTIHGDEGLSGKRADNRPGLQAALREACECKGVLVAYDLTRLARSTRDAIEIAERLQRCGAQLSLTSGDIDTTTPHGEFVFTLFAALGQLERRQIGARTRLALGHKRASGERYCRVAPYGYRVKGDKLVEVKAERTALRLMQSLREQGTGYVRIAAELDRRGISTRNGKPWNWSSVRAILSNRMRETEGSDL